MIDGRFFIGMLTKSQGRQKIKKKWKMREKNVLI